MNIIFFIRLLRKHIWLILLCALMLTTLVYFKTSNQPKVYVSSTTIYTGITTGTSIETQQQARVDLFGTRTSFDNMINIVKSKKTIETVALQLFTSHMLLKGPDPQILSQSSYEKLMKLVPDEVKRLVVKNDFKKTFNNFEKYINKDFNNFIYGLLNFSHPHYSIKSITGNLKVQRIQTSDMIEITYSNDDPGIVFHTLNLLNDVFIQVHTNLKSDQSDAVVSYFQNQLDIANEKLKDAEDELLEFNKTHNIINYYEQTKHIASEREHFSMEFLKVRMEYAAARSVIHVLENQMTPNARNQLNSTEILNIRRQLSQESMNLSMKEFKVEAGQEVEEVDLSELAVLKLRVAGLQKELKKRVEEQFNLDFTTDGLSLKKVINEWLVQVILMESSKAKNTVAEQKNREFVDLYSLYSPLGATMKRLERKIDVAEREYLSILHSLGLAKLRQQSAELNANLKITEPPYFPIMSEPSKRKFLLIIAFLVGILLPSFIVILLEFFDKTIKTALRAEKFTGLEVSSIYPNLNMFDKGVEVESILNRSVDIAVRSLIIESNRLEIDNQSSIPVVCHFYSHQRAEGKTYLLIQMANKLKDIGLRVLIVSPDSMNIIGIESRNYNLEQDIKDVVDIDNWVLKPGNESCRAYDFLFVESGDINGSFFPKYLFERSYISFLVINANRTWESTDEFLMKDVLKLNNIYNHKPCILLNGVDLWEMETVLGDLPRKRSIVRRLLKNLLKMRLNQKKSF